MSTLDWDKRLRINGGNYWQLWDCINNLFFFFDKEFWRTSIFSAAYPMKCCRRCNLYLTLGKRQHTRTRHSRITDRQRHTQPALCRMVSPLRSFPWEFHIKSYRWDSDGNRKRAVVFNCQSHTWLNLLLPLLSVRNLNNYMSDVFFVFCWQAPNTHTAFWRRRGKL